MKHLIYADNAATTQMDVDAFEAMKPYLLHEYGNASQPYSFARQPKKRYKRRGKPSPLVSVPLPEEIYFTSGGTESDNWAIKGIAFRNYDHRATITTALNTMLFCMLARQSSGLDVQWHICCLIREVCSRQIPLSGISQMKHFLYL